MTLRTRLQRAPLLGFLALTFAWSWACWALSPAIKPQLPWLATLLMFAGSFGPSLAAIVVVASTRGLEGLRAWLSRCLQWRIGWTWWAFALLLPLALMSIAAGLHIALGGAIATSPASGHLLMTLVNLPLVLLLGGPMGEEFGWRGYALPVLQDRLGWRAASLGLGLVWGMWHLPLFFIDGTAQAHIPLALFLLSVVAMSVVFAWLVNHTAGSVVAALVFHTAINFWPSVVPVLPTETSYGAYALVVALLVLLAIAALLSSGLATGGRASGTSSGFNGEIDLMPESRHP
ncbi:type II CAAX endopeptidase family protein [Rhodoferax sp.]|uniref:CPBP family intramembrane glutamic endopeptidase n=1 Tax=Rhodoferax sp. TaxID=50421 RepID=UPI0025DF328A|nr:type II CAAX endopeptidase family protein [Rhodoferax sp.]